jgi:hypothetical protein
MLQEALTPLLEIRRRNRDIAISAHRYGVARAPGCTKTAPDTSIRVHRIHLFANRDRLGWASLVRADPALGAKLRVANRPKSRAAHHVTAPELLCAQDQTAARAAVAEHGRPVLRVVDLMDEPGLVELMELLFRLFSADGPPDAPFDEERGGGVKRHARLAGRMALRVILTLPAGAADQGDRL